MRDTLLVIASFVILGAIFAAVNWIGDNFSNILGPIALVGMAAASIKLIFMFTK